MNNVEDAEDILDRMAPVEVDRIGNEAYSAHFAHYKTLKITAIALAMLLCVSIVGNITLGMRRPDTRWIRIDASGNATPMSLTASHYNPEEGDIRKYLQDWVTARYSRLRATVGSTYKVNYYFIDKVLASKLMVQDLHDQTVAKVLTGQVPENDIVLHTIELISFNKQSGAGSARITFDKVPAVGAVAGTTEKWVVNLTFCLNPDQIAAQARKDPEYELTNAIGLTIVDFHESRLLSQ